MFEVLAWRDPLGLPAKRWQVQGYNKVDHEKSSLFPKAGHTGRIPLLLRMLPGAPAQHARRKAALVGSEQAMVH